MRRNNHNYIDRGINGLYTAGRGPSTLFVLCCFDWMCQASMVHLCWYCGSSPPHPPTWWCGHPLLHVRPLPTGLPHLTVGPSCAPWGGALMSCKSYKCRPWELHRGSCRLLCCAGTGSFTLTSDNHSLWQYGWKHVRIPMGGGVCQSLATRLLGYPLLWRAHTAVQFFCYFVKTNACRWAASCIPRGTHTSICLSTISSITQMYWLSVS